jgi:hypothetical protein
VATVGRVGTVAARLAMLALLVGGGMACGGDADEADDTDEGAALRRELLAMQEADQAERTGAAAGSWNDDERTERLAEIVDEHGWPASDLVGDDGASAAWLIAQHSDQDVDFQERALELMRAAAEEGHADRTELAYLEDRVALNRGGAQTYGTQVGCVDGRAEPARLADPEGVEQRRAEVGLQPLADYLAELAPNCAAEAEAQTRPDAETQPDAGG